MDKQAALETLRTLSLIKSGQATRTFEEGFLIGYINTALDQDAAFEKVAAATNVPVDMVKLAMVKKALSMLGGLLGGYLLTQAPGALKWGWNQLKPGLASGIDVGQFGGLNPKEQAEFQKMITRMSLINAQAQNRQQQLRWAMNPMGGGTPFSTT